MTITRLDFEALAARFIEALPNVKSTRSLLSNSIHLLEADAGALLKIHPEHRPEVVAAFPNDRQAWFHDNLSQIRWWKDQEPVPIGTWGYPQERCLEVNGERFEDGLVVFSQTNLGESEGIPHELIILRRDKTAYRFSTYHCAVASALFFHFLAKEMARQERFTKNEYARLLSFESLFAEDWPAFLSRVSSQAPKKLLDADFIGPAAVLKQGYRRRSEKIDLEGNPPFPSTEPYASLFRFLEKEIGFSEVISEGILACRKKNSEAWKAGLIVLELAWTRVYQVVSGEGLQMELSPGHTEKLLEVTKEMVLDELRKSKVTGGQEVTEMGRDTLRLLFAVLIAGAGLFKRRCLGVSHREGDPEEPFEEVRRDSMLNLSRYMLSVIEILERRNGLVECLPVSRVEVLEGLLFMIDRYAHVELGVDPRLHIRERLAQGMPAEIRRHLAQGFYRDHMLHVIDVFLFGEWLLRTQIPDGKGGFRELVDLLPQPQIGSLSAAETRVWIFRNWAAAALLHDIGYQAEGELQTPQGVSNLQAFFSLSRVPRRVELDPRGIEKNGWSVWHEALLETVVRASGGSKVAGPFPKIGTYPNTDHGILSALRCSQLLGHADTEDVVDLDQCGFPILCSYFQAIHAIAHHNLFNHKVVFREYPLAGLLRLCDELQEWDRRRVNIEKMVKNLYLEIEQGWIEELAGSVLLKTFFAGIVFSGAEEPGPAWRISPPGNRLKLFLSYRNPVEAQYDALGVFLGKAYNLQNIDLSGPDVPSGPWPDWEVRLLFPHPPEYRGLTELGLYGLIQEEVCGLPPLLRFPSSSAPPGLTCCGDCSNDCVSICVSGPSKANTQEDLNRPNGRLGWQTFDPGLVRGPIIEFKRQFLANRLLAPGSRWLASP